LTAVLASCVDDTPLTFDVKEPASIAELKYLNDYDVLKSYIDRTANPNFKLGLGVSVSEYNAKGLVYRLANSNFDEIVAGWEMKHGGVVQDDGSLNLANVSAFLETAQNAGISVYGHTLVWHANQNAKYLNGLIADLFIPSTGEPSWDSFFSADFETDDASYYSSSPANVMSFSAAGEGFEGKGRALKIINEEVWANDWNCQLFVTFPKPVAAGEKYRLTMNVKAGAPASFSTQAHTAPGAYKHWDFFGSISATPEWTTFTKEITISADQATCNTIAFNLGLTATTYYFDNITVEKYNDGTGSGPSYLPLSTADFETDDKSNYLGNNNAALSYTAAGSGFEGKGRALIIGNSEVRANDWDCQFFMTFPKATEVGEKYRFTINVRADEAASFSTQAHTVPYTYKHWDFVGAISATTEWTTYTREITINDNTAGCTAIAFNLGNTATNYYFDNMKWEKYTEGGIWIIKTPEEKKELIHNALETWISGIMTVSESVKAWDIVNEPMSDWPDPSQLKTGVGKTDMGADEFYWQDYLGKDYAATAIRIARSQEGHADDKLFINDYGLESSLDKCKGLIEYVKYVESKGVKVDGIGTQMHVTLNSANRETIAEHFRLLAATGKLIKISELDMGIAVDGKNIKTEEATDEQLRAQADLYKYIVKTYFEIIPAAQRYGITQWAATDSPASSSWRGGEPIGLWNLNYNRKHAYAGFADGLSGK
jgi:GH35 family endo-1,4-beta-xylanase